MQKKQIGQAKSHCYLFRRYHKQYKASTIADLKRDKLEVVVTTFETCRDNIVSAFLLSFHTIIIYIFML